MNYVQIIALLDLLGPILILLFSKISILTMEISTQAGKTEFATSWLVNAE